jgi:nucleotide-binding universal stress UspA family protein
LRILVPIDGSPNAIRALKAAVNQSKAFGGEIVIVTVIPTPGILVQAPVGLGLPPDGISQYYDRQEESAGNLLDQAVSVCQKQGISNVKTQTVRADKSIVEEIIETAARRNVDLIVIGTRGLGGFKKLLMGSVSSGVVTHASCDVLVVR